MSRALYLYTSLSLKELEAILAAHQDEFDHYLTELFSDEERSVFEKSIDAIGAVYVQPIITELTFEDFTPKPGQDNEQRHFFETCRSSLCIENLPYLEENPFQVSYLLMLFSSLPEVLIDQGGFEELLFKNGFLQTLESYKSIDTFISSPKEKKIRPPQRTQAVDPIDFLINDVRQLLIKHQAQGVELSQYLAEAPEQVLQIFQAFQDIPHNDSHEIFRHSRLKPKEFDDYLERLKLTLKKIH